MDIVCNLAIFAGFVKILIIIIIVRLQLTELFKIISSGLPNHFADAFSPPVPECISYLDCFIENLVDGFVKWDSIYFHFIAVNGYVLENTLAFFPLFPSIVHVIATIGSQLISNVCFSTHCKLAGIFVNFICSILCCIQLFNLSKLAGLSNAVSITTAVLFVANPASVFFATLYSESLYCLLVVSSLVYLQSGRKFLGCVFICLSVCCRSNGLINAGFACYPHFVRLISFIYTTLIGLDEKPGRFRAYRIASLQLLPRLSPDTFAIIRILIATFTPYIIFQIYASLLFCSEAKQPFLPWIFPVGATRDLLLYANELRVATAVSEKSADWCASTPFSSYAKIQSKFWNVGFLRYYQLKQLPNFVLVLPLFMLVFLVVRIFIRSDGKVFFSMGVLAKERRMRFFLPHVYHLIFLAVFGAVNMHIQVLTRMLFSSCPILYWYSACFLLDEDLIPVTVTHVTKEASSNDQWHRKKKRPIKVSGTFLQMARVLQPFTYTNRKHQALISYFLIYLLIGCVLHSNFLPWT